MRFRMLFAMLALLAASPVRADPSVMELCRQAAIRAADQVGVPREVMLAITLVETRTKRGGASGPWPWTVNVAGRGGWFDSRAAALLHAQRALASGQTSFDVGCFQLNYRWHGEHFTSIDQMFEPGVSGLYAARFLKSLHGETGDWIRASGLYHSRTDRHAERYRALVVRAMARGGGGPDTPVRVAAGPVPPERPGIMPAGGPPRLAVPSGGVALVILRRSTGSLFPRAGEGS